MKGTPESDITRETFTTRSDTSLDQPTKTVEMTIRIESEANGVEVHQLKNFEYEGFSFNPETQVYSFFAKEAVFHPGSQWVIQSAKVCSPQEILKQMEQEEGGEQ